MADRKIPFIGMALLAQWEITLTYTANCPSVQRAKSSVEKTGWICIYVEGNSHRGLVWWSTSYMTGSSLY